MKVVFNLALLLAFAFLGAARADACQCMFGGGAVCQDYWTAAAVFVGTVVDIKTVTVKRENYDQRQRLVRFTLEEPFRGVAGAEVEVLTGMGGGDCGIEFKAVQRYLVYATLFEGKLFTGICMRTKPIESAAEDLKYMRGLKNAKPGGAIYGEVRSYTQNRNGEPRAGASISIDGPEPREITADAKGAYRFDGLPAGEYTVKLSPPAGTNSRQTEHKVTLANGGCAVVSFWLENDGQISGRVLDLQGLPINKAEIVLTEADKERYRGHIDYAYSDQDGRYAFKLVPPGRYTLTIRFDGMTSQNRPFPQMYYPGVSDRAQAKVITVAEGQALANYDLQMPPLPLEYEVTGSVVWPNGKPAAEARVGYVVKGDSVFYAINQEDGATFRFKAYEGLTLTLRASIENSKSKNLYGPWIEVTVKPDLPPVKLVLPAPE